MKFGNNLKKKRSSRNRHFRMERRPVMADPVRFGPIKVEVCVLCGEPWKPAVKVHCKCGGSFTWGKKKGGPPDNWAARKDGQWLSLKRAE